MGNEKRTDNRRLKVRGAEGFSLIELLIVVAIILIIAAIAVPNYLHSRMAANESSAVQSMRTVVSSEVAYQSSYNQGYAISLLNLGGGSGASGPTSAGLIDDNLAHGVRSGYIFTYVGTNLDGSGNPQGYTLNGDPTIPGSSGQRHFYTDQSGSLHQNFSSVAGPNDPPVQ